MEAIPGDERKTYKSVLLAVKGEKLEAFLKGWEGTIQCVFKSPYRPNHGRKNWFIGCNVFFPPKSEDIVNERDVSFEATRSSGPGGQAVNKISSAIRATHRPTGVVVFAQEERSQLMNKKLALARLASALKNAADQKRQDFQQEVWQQHNELERGNPTRVYQEKGGRMVRA